MAEISIQSIIEMLAQSTGFESAEKIIDASIKEANLTRKRTYSEEEFQNICECLRSRGGYIKTFALLVATPAFREMQYQKMIEKERKEKEEIEMLYKKLQETNEELRKMHQELIEKEKLATIGLLAGGVGHELRNPLATVKNISFFFKRYLKTDNAKVKEFVDMLSNEVDKANKIITDLLIFSRTQTQILNKVWVSIDKIIEESISDARIGESVEVIVEILPQLKEVYVDPDKMKYVFVNLITNACEAMNNCGKLKISVNVEEEEMKICFTDTGCGMSKEMMEHIFKPLFTTKAKGIGLGLAIARNIIKQHQGEITVESKEGEGSTFCVILNRVEELSNE